MHTYVTATHTHAGRLCNFHSAIAIWTNSKRWFLGKGKIRRAFAPAAAAGDVCDRPYACMTWPLMTVGEALRLSRAAAARLAIAGHQRRTRTRAISSRSQVTSAHHQQLRTTCTPDTRRETPQTVGGHRAGTTARRLYICGALGRQLSSTPRLWNPQPPGALPSARRCASPPIRSRVASLGRGSSQLD